MNIFVLDPNPIHAALDMVDKHVVKMILETAQLLSTAHRIIDGYEYIDKTETGRKVKRWIIPDLREESLYKATHINHPSAVWARENDANYTWLSLHFSALLYEYKYRYEKIHATEALQPLLHYPPLKIKHVDNLEPTSFAIAMDEQYRISNDPVECYRHYYKVGKAHLHSWKKRGPPSWIL
jgi:hypothetical protein